MKIFGTKTYSKIIRILAGTVVFGFVLTTCTSSGGSGRWTGPVTTIYIGHHYPQEMATSSNDPNMRRDQVENMNARRLAERDVYNKLGVIIEWVQYTNLETQILNGAEDGRKFDMVRIVGAQQGDILGSNLLQPIDQFAGLFADDDTSWMFWPQVFDHNWFLNMVLRGGPDTPLVYNIGMLEKIPALRENGKTVLPIHLWQEGKWTWSAFEEYLEKVNEYWGSDANRNLPWSADYTMAALLAIYSNGGHIYNSEEGLGFASDESKEAVSFIERLITKRLLRLLPEDLEAGTSEMRANMDNWRFQWGHSVFCCLQRWLAPNMIERFNERREKIGIVPFPRPDWLEPDNPAYRQANDARDCYAVPANVSAERVELAIKAFKEYTSAYYRRLANSDRVMDFLEGDRGARSSADRMAIDIANRDYGALMMEVWKEMGSRPQINEYAKNVGLWNFWRIDVLGDSLYSLNGAASYGGWADAKLPEAQERLDRMRLAVEGSR